MVLTVVKSAGLADSAWAVATRTPLMSMWHCQPAKLQVYSMVMVRACPAAAVSFQTRSSELREKDMSVVTHHG